MSFTSSPRPNGPGTPDGECNIDLVICMDQSESMTPDEYSQMQNFVADVIRLFPDQGPNRNQVSVLAFDNLVDELFSLNTLSSVNEEVEAVERHQQGAGTTRIDLCVQFSTRVTGLRSRELFPRVLLVVTDGQSSKGSLLSEALRASDLAGFTRIAVGIGCEVNEAELRQIAGQNVFLVDGFSSLSRVTADVVSLFCSTGSPTRAPGSTFSGNTFPPPFPPSDSNPFDTPGPVSPISSPIQTCRPCPWNISALNDLLTQPGIPYDSLDRRLDDQTYRLSENAFNAFSSGEWPPKVKGPDWKLVARQSAGYYFRPFELSVNPDDPAAENYAVLSDLERYRATNSMFTFKLHYPCHNVTNVWMQNNNPAVERTGVCCYKPLVVQDDKLGWSGLKFNGKTALMDGSVSSLTRQSYFAVGAFYDFNGGIPGFLPLQGVTRVELYVLPPRESIVICGKPPEIPGTRKNLDSRALEGTVVTYECQCGLFECSGQCFQDAVCLPNPTRELSREDQLIGVEAGQWVGVPKPGDCIVGATSEVDLKEKRKKKKNNRKSRCWEETQC